MTDDNEVVDLLQENIDAQNRTTHAVRAFVRFFFIQLVAATIALPLVYFGTILGVPGLVLIAFLVLVVGIVWSSSAGWAELGLSDRFAAAREEARALRRDRSEAERGKAALARETAAVARREARRGLFASKRFRVGALVGTVVGLVAVTAGTIFVQTSMAERAAEIAAREAQSADQLAGLQATYLRAVDDCASSAGVGDI
jgi:ammonia channel protein AmtB